jgi:hypothetical protein
VAGAALKGNSAVVLALVCWASVAREPRKPARLAENNNKDGAIPESRKFKEIAVSLKHDSAKSD